MTIWTIGHSTRTQNEVFDLLFGNDIDLLVDVRSYPSSKHCPQWGRAEILSALPSWLSYRWSGATLGGKRKALPLAESINGGLRNASFRGYADYMQTSEFQTGLAGLVALAETRRVAIMCAEAVWWRCHRSMIADALVARGEDVFHIMSSKTVTPHKLRDFATADSGRVIYPIGAGRN